MNANPTMRFVSIIAPPSLTLHKTTHHSQKSSLQRDSSPLSQNSMTTPLEAITLQNVASMTTAVCFIRKKHFYGSALCHSVRSRGCGLGLFGQDICCELGIWAPGTGL